MADNAKPRRRNGEGSVYQRKSDGRWVGAAYVLTTSGVRRRKVVYGDSWEEAHEQLVQLVANSHKGIPVPDRSWPMRDYLPYWLQVHARELRAKTMEGYESVVRLHLMPGLGSKRLDKLSAHDIRAFLAAFREKCQCCAAGLDKRRGPDKQCCSRGKCCRRMPSVRQVQFVHAVLRNALAHAVRDELVPRNVAMLVKVKAPRYKVGRGLSVDQVRTLLKTVEGHRLYPLYVVAATMGLRRGELLGLRWADLDLNRGTWLPDKTAQRVAGGLVLQDTKTEGSDGLLPLPELTWLTLLDHQQRQQAERERMGERWQDHDLVFPSEVGTPMEPRNLNRHFEGVRARAGLPGVRLHDLRHTMVTLLLELGVPPHLVQAIARHADVDITLKIYAHTNLDAMREGMKRLDDRLD
ncbi:tyrosine-type recombinase/integrase [Dactylosporangium sp. CA-139066]|uniref:tyrosine-type recombinase/integrase n=1 Tax=Dactylosporangium sp. CA-139066 TaxID=3239930 RepID=UPI003D94925E